MWQLQVECTCEEVEHISALLDTSGALSLTLTDLKNNPILEPDLGTTPLWPEIMIDALYNDENTANQAKKQLVSSYRRSNVIVSKVPDNDWEHAWTSNFKPMRFGKRLWIYPSYTTPPDPNSVHLILDPGLAFGTGTHPTTALCLTWLEQASLQHTTLIDYGCGSGILALAALKLGASHVFASDIDEQALTATTNNAQNNAIIDETLTVCFPETLIEPADFIIANILLKPLLTLKPHFQSLLKPQGTLIFSGILEEQVPELLAAYQDRFNTHSIMTQEGWALITFR